MSKNKFKVGDSVYVKEAAPEDLEEDEDEEGVETSYSCTVCDIKYTKSNSYYKHMRNKHPSTVPSKPNFKKTKDTATKQSLDRRNRMPPPAVRKEQQVKNSSEKFSCDQCDKSYKYKFSLSRHVVKKSHFKEKSTCNLKVVSPSSSLNLGSNSESYRYQHKNVHTKPVEQVNGDEEGQTPAIPYSRLKCGFCPQVFRSHEKQNTHFQTIHLPALKKVFAKKRNPDPNALPKFMCKLCKKKFMFQESLRAHILTHSEKSRASSPLLLNTDIVDLCDDEEGETSDMNVSVEIDVNGHDILFDSTTAIAKSNPVKISQTVLGVSFCIFQEILPVTEVKPVPQAVRDVVPTLQVAIANLPVVQIAEQFIVDIIEDVMDSVVSQILTIIESDRFFVADENGDNIEEVAGDIVPCDMKVPSDKSQLSEISSGILENDVKKSEKLKRGVSKSQMSESLTRKMEIERMIRKYKKSRERSLSNSKTAVSMQEATPKRIVKLSTPARVSSTGHKVSSTSSPLITGVFDCPRGKLLPRHVARPSLQPDSSLSKLSTHGVSPSRGIHPLLLPLYMNSPPPVPDHSQAGTSSSRNVDNLVSVFIEGRSDDSSIQQQQSKRRVD